MTPINKKKVITYLLIVAAIGILLVFLRMNEDDWVCKNGLWVKHGNPTATMPTYPCILVNSVI
jgi:hypothetical protein